MTTESCKVLGQAFPAANTDVSLYTVPALAQAVSSTLTACNQASTNTTIRIAIRVAGENLAATGKQYIAYELPLGAYETLPITIGKTLGAGDIISVRSGNGAVSFNAFGSEIA